MLQNGTSMTNYYGIGYNFLEVVKMGKTDKKEYEELIRLALPALQSKKNELISLGYEDVTIELIIDCLFKNSWKIKAPDKIYKIVQDILNLKPSIYMNFMTTTAYSLDDDLMSSITAVTDEK